MRSRQRTGQARWRRLKIGNQGFPKPVVLGINRDLFEESLAAMLQKQEQLLGMGGNVRS